MANQAATPHARALSRFDGANFSGRTVRERSGAAYRYDGDKVTISRDAATAEYEITWAFGSGVQAITPVIERGGRVIEHRVSWYRNGNKLGLTPGHSIESPPEFDDALGVDQTGRNATRCFACHRPLEEPGVRCQACHGDGNSHRAAPSKSNIRRDRSIALCTACHRSPDRTFASSTPELEDPLSVRFAPVGLEASRCFQKGRTLTCVTCHNPHGETAKLTVTQVCQTCHASPARKQCPRTPACESCHMRKSSPVPNLTFTDHRIRAYLD